MCTISYVRLSACTQPLIPSPHTLKRQPFFSALGPRAPRGMYAPDVPHGPAKTTSRGHCLTTGRLDGASSNALPLESFSV